MMAVVLESEWAPEKNSVRVTSRVKPRKWVFRFCSLRDHSRDEKNAHMQGFAAA